MFCRHFPHFSWLNSFVIRSIFHWTMFIEDQYHIRIGSGKFCIDILLPVFDIISTGADYLGYDAAVGPHRGAVAHAAVRCRVYLWDGAVAKWPWPVSSGGDCCGMYAARYHAAENRQPLARPHGGDDRIPNGGCGTHYATHTQQMVSYFKS